jgi:hypothetical protein
MSFTSIMGNLHRGIIGARVYTSIAVQSGLAFATCALLVACGGSSGSPSGGNILVKVTPSTFTMGIGSNYQFAATVTGASDTAVSWKVNGVAGGNSSVGSIDPAGFYIAPGSIPAGAITVTAVAHADGTTQGSAAITLLPADPLGAANGQPVTCPTSTGISLAGTCYAVALSCPGTTDLNGYLWVNTPSGTPVGTVMLTTGGDGSGLYWPGFTYGSNVVNSLVQAGYITVQTAFGGDFTGSQPNGWVTGPGGLRRVACRYATLAKWVKDNINPSGAAMCATGNSGGSALIGYALAHYNAGSIFNMVEATSGPPISRLDYSCECNQPDVPDPCGTATLSQCAGLTNAQKYIDPAYTSPICSQAVQSHSTTNSAQFLSDSILSPEATMAYPNTVVHFVWGGQDLSSAPAMGQAWQQAITEQLIPPSTAFACVADAPHTLPDAQDGAQEIVNDIVHYCR